MTVINQHDEEIFKTFKDVKAKYKVTKGFHMPWHFSQSGQYVCLLEGGLECRKDYNWDEETETEWTQYIVTLER
jgi:hypothetical protein